MLSHGIHNTHEFPQKISADSVKPFGQLYIYMNEELY